MEHPASHVESHWLHPEPETEPGEDDEYPYKKKNRRCRTALCAGTACFIV